MKCYRKKMEVFLLERDITSSPRERGVWDSPKATLCPHNRMRTPIYGEIFRITDTDRDVTQVDYTIEEDVIRALATFFSDARVTSVPTDNGVYAFRMYTGERVRRSAPILVLTNEFNEKVYLTGDHNILQELSESPVDNLDDLLEKPRDHIGGWGRLRVLHKHTPLSW